MAWDIMDWIKLAKGRNQLKGLADIIMVIIFGLCKCGKFHE